MSAVVSAIPLAVPVFRMRATLACRDIGSPAHRAAEQLLELGCPLEDIAATLGLRLDQATRIVEQLEGTGGVTVHDLRVWLDVGHKAVLTAEDGLDVVPSVYERDLARLPVLPPQASELQPGAFSRAASDRAGPRARLEVATLVKLEPDLGASAAADHVLHLTDTSLAVGPEGLEVHWHGVPDPGLTKFASKALAHPGFAPGWERLTPLAAEVAAERLRESTSLSPADSYGLDLDPAEMRDRLLDLVHGARKQVLVGVDSAQPRLPDWLLDALHAVVDRGVDAILLVGQPGRLKGRRISRLRLLRSKPPCGALVVRDGDRAIAHSDPRAFGAPASIAELEAQAAIEVHRPERVRALVEALGLQVPDVPRRAAERSVRELASEALTVSLRQQAETLEGLSAQFDQDDVAAFSDQMERLFVHPGDRKRVGQIAAGVAWERAVHSVCIGLAARHANLVVDYLRWAPEEGGIDLDIVMRDLTSKTWWLIDAKHALPMSKHVALVGKQQRVARKHGLIPDGWKVCGLIVHPRSGRPLPKLTNVRWVERVTLDQLEEALGQAEP